MFMSEEEKEYLKKSIDYIGERIYCICDFYSENKNCVGKINKGLYLVSEIQYVNFSNKKVVNYIIEVNGLDKRITVKDMMKNFKLESRKSRINEILN